MKIRAKITLTFLVVVIVALAIIGLTMQLISSQMLTDQIHSHLETTAQSRADHVETVLKMYEQRARFLTSKTWLRKHLKSYYKTNDQEY